MDKRVLLTVGISMGILLVWMKFFSPPPPTPPANTPAQTVTTDGGTTVAAPAPAPGAPVAEAPKPPPADRPPAVIDEIDQPALYHSVWTSWGAVPTTWKLLDPQYQRQVTRADGKKELEPIDLVTTHGANAPLIISLPQSGIEVPPEAAWQKLAAGAYAWENDQVRIEKRFTFPKDSYQLDLAVTVENKSDKQITVPLALSVTGYQDPNAKPGGMFSPGVWQTQGMCDLNGKLKNADFQSLLKEGIDLAGQVKWVGIDYKYFIMAMAPSGADEKKCSVRAAPDGTVIAQVRLGERAIASKAKSEYHFTGFAGPKLLHKLDDVKADGQDARLGDAVDYGWKEVLARPMLAVLKAVHYVVPNWGFAIIVLTLLIKAITWWPTQKSMRSMREMSKLKPEIDKLKAKYGEDKQKFNAAMMALYKERGVNPLGGCLPMLIQMPIYIALYSMLAASVELYRSGFMFWIKDLTAADPFYVLPLLTGAIMFAQQKLSPASPDPQQKTMMYMMPIMFTAFSIFLPAGLTLYILTNTLLSMGQQWLINRADPVKTPAKKPEK
jgi:YidC/Oxa1 family membrane protein insertase